MKKLLIGGVLVISASAQISQANELIRKSVVMSDNSNRTIEVVQILRPNNDGSFTVLKIEPEREAVTFFSRACKEELGPEAEYLGLENEARISGTASYTYSCKLEHQL